MTFAQEVRRHILRIQIRQLEHKVRRELDQGDVAGAALTASRSAAVKAQVLILFGRPLRRAPLTAAVKGW